MKRLMNTYNSLEIWCNACSGVSTLAEDGGEAQFLQGTASIHQEFRRTSEYDLMDLMSEYEVYKVDEPFGAGKALILGDKVSRLNSLFVDIDKLSGVVIVPKGIKAKERFAYAIDYISRMNIAMSGDGYQVALMNGDGKVFEVIDHVSDMDDVDEVCKYLDQLAKTIGKDSVKQ